MNTPCLVAWLATFALAAHAAAPAERAAPVVDRYREIRRYPVPEARQGVVVDADSFWAVSNHALARYRRVDGVRMPRGNARRGSR